MEQQPQREISPHAVIANLSQRVAELTTDLAVAQIGHLEAEKEVYALRERLEKLQKKEEDDGDG